MINKTRYCSKGLAVLFCMGSSDIQAQEINTKREQSQPMTNATDLLKTRRDLNASGYNDTGHGINTINRALGGLNVGKGMHDDGLPGLIVEYGFAKAKPWVKRTAFGLTMVVRRGNLIVATGVSEGTGVLFDQLKPLAKKALRYGGKSIFQDNTTDSEKTIRSQLEQKSAMGVKTGRKHYGPYRPMENADPFYNKTPQGFTDPPDRKLVPDDVDEACFAKHPGIGLMDPEERKKFCETKAEEDLARAKCRAKFSVSYLGSTSTLKKTLNSLLKRKTPSWESPRQKENREQMISEVRQLLKKENDANKKLAECLIEAGIAPKTKLPF